MELFSITVPAESDRLDELTDFVQSHVEMDMKMEAQINIVIDELFSNVVKFSYENGGNFTLSVGSDEQEVKLILSDNGKPFNPLSIPDPDTNLGAMEREIGGLGIFMVKKMTDSFDYRYENGSNILTLTKKK